MLVGLTIKSVNFILLYPWWDHLLLLSIETGPEEFAFSASGEDQRDGSWVWEEGEI